MDRSFPRLTTREWLLVLTALLIVGLLVYPYRAQQASRYALTAAVVERGTVILDEYEGVLGIDRAVRDGHIYSDKAPGQPMLAVPFYALGRAVAVEEATTLRVDGNLGLWWVTLWSSVIPGIALVLMMQRRASTIDADKAVPVTMALFAGTLLLPFSALLFGHVLAAALLYGSFLLLVGRYSPLRLAAAGFLAGIAVTVEYTSFLGVIVLAVYSLVKHRRRVALFIAGGLPTAIGLAIYNAIAFGNPLVLSYQYTAFTDVTDTSRPLLHMFTPATVENAIRLLFEGRGLVVATPLVLVALGGAVWRLRRGAQPDSAVGLAMIGAFVLLPLLWGNPWGGDSPGARYMIPALPFLAVPLIWSWRRWPRLTLVAATLSALTMIAATLTDPLLHRDSPGGLGTWLRMLGGGDTVETLPVMAIGGVGWIIHSMVLLVVAVLLFKARRAAIPQPPDSP